MNTQTMYNKIRGSIYLLMSVLFFSVVILNESARAGVPAVNHKKAAVAQADDPYHTAIKHAEFAQKAPNLKDIQMHLHHVLNCLEGKTGKDFDASFGNPCQGQGALETLKKDSPDIIRTNNAIALAEVGVKLKSEKATRFVAQAVYEILYEGK